MGRYVQTYTSLLSFIPMKEKYAQKVAILHGLQPWACNTILQRSEVLATCQEMMKVAECMEDDSMHKKVRMPLLSQFNTRVNIISATQIACGPERGQKKKWDKNPPKDKGILAKKKPYDVAKIECFNCDELGHFAKDYEKVK